MVDDRDNWDDEAPAQPKRGMSTFSKFLLVFGIVGGMGMLACCGVCGFVGYSFAPNVSTNPQQVAAKGAEICEITLPADYEGRQSMEIDNFMMLMRLVHFERTDGKGRLMLMEVLPRMGDEKDFKEGFQKGFAESFDEKQDQFHTLVNTSSETKTFQLGGQEAEFVFERGRCGLEDDPASGPGELYRQAGNGDVHAGAGGLGLESGRGRGDHSVDPVN